MTRSDKDLKKQLVFLVEVSRSATECHPGLAQKGHNRIGARVRGTSGISESKAPTRKAPRATNSACVDQTSRGLFILDTPPKIHLFPLYPFPFLSGRLPKDLRPLSEDGVGREADERCWRSTRIVVDDTSVRFTTGFRESSPICLPTRAPPRAPARADPPFQPA